MPGKMEHGRMIPRHTTEQGLSETAPGEDEHPEAADAGVHSTPGSESDLAQAREEFISLWGQMGSKWGIPRTMAEVHALLFIEGRPLNTDEVMDRLHISRGNASMTLRSLVEWGIVQRAHMPGDRKEYFTAEQDVWKLFRTIVRERKKREIDPLLEALHECRQRTGGLSGADDVQKPRVGAVAGRVRRVALDR